MLSRAVLIRDALCFVFDVGNRLCKSKLTHTLSQFSDLQKLVAVFARSRFLSKQLNKKHERQNTTLTGGGGGGGGAGGLSASQLAAIHGSSTTGGGGHRRTPSSSLKLHDVVSTVMTQQHNRGPPVVTPIVSSLIPVSGTASGTSAAPTTAPAPADSKLPTSAGPSGTANNNAGLLRTLGITLTRPESHVVDTPQAQLERQMTVGSFLAERQKLDSTLNDEDGRRLAVASVERDHRASTEQAAVDKHHAKSAASGEQKLVVSSPKRPTDEHSLPPPAAPSVPGPASITKHKSSVPVPLASGIDLHTPTAADLAAEAEDNLRLQRILERSELVGAAITARRVAGQSDIVEPEELVPLSSVKPGGSGSAGGSGLATDEALAVAVVTTPKIVAAATTSVESDTPPTPVSLRNRQQQTATHGHAPAVTDLATDHSVRTGSPATSNPSAPAATKPKRSGRTGIKHRSAGAGGVAAAVAAVNNHGKSQSPSAPTRTLPTSGGSLPRRAQASPFRHSLRLDSTASGSSSVDAIAAAASVAGSASAADSEMEKLRKSLAELTSKHAAILQDLHSGPSASSSGAVPPTTESAAQSNVGE